MLFLFFSQLIFLNISDTQHQHCPHNRQPKQWFPFLFKKRQDCAHDSPWYFRCIVYAIACMVYFCTKHILTPSFMNAFLIKEYESIINGDQATQEYPWMARLITFDANRRPYSETFLQLSQQKSFKIGCSKTEGKGNQEKLRRMPNELLATFLGTFFRARKVT